MKFRSLCCLVFTFYINFTQSRSHPHIVRSADNIFFLWKKNNNSLHYIPNVDTVEALDIDPASVDVISDEDLKILYKGKDVPSLITSDSSPDELLRVRVQFVEVTAPADYILEKKYFPNMFNPSIEKFGDKIIAAYRKCSGLWDCLVSFFWFDDFNFVYNSEQTYLGVNRNLEFQISQYNHLQEDPRLLLLHNGSIVVMYMGKHSLMEAPYVLLSMGSMDDVNKPSTLSFGDTIRMYDPSVNAMGKNWVLFEHDSRLLMIESINPLHILEIVGLREGNEAALKTVVQMNEVRLPWDATYGSHIRGGTTAISVKGTYLSIFHTVAQLEAPYKTRTYFMGAISYCPRHPFNIHKMSKYPIVDDEWYRGSWTAVRDIDFVVFPTGILADPDGDHVWVSFGVQNVNAWIVKVNIDSLFESMELVAECETL